MNRFKEALFIDAGAGNLTAITSTLLRMCKEVMKETQCTERVWKDPAIRLVVHQMAHLTNVHDVISSISKYTEVVDKCQALSDLADKRDVADKA